jgi:hypothetical protein
MDCVAEQWKYRDLPDGPNHRSVFPIGEMI